MISYYELLGMIKEGKIPKRLCVKLPTLSHDCIYVAEYDFDGTFNFYTRVSEDDSINYKSFLGECFLESSMFDVCIEILNYEDELDIWEEKFEDIKEIRGKVVRDKTLSHDETQDGIVKNFNLIIEKVNLLIRNQNKIIERLENER